MFRESVKPRKDSRDCAGDMSVSPRPQVLDDDKRGSFPKASSYPILENAVRMVEARRTRSSTTASDLQPEQRNVKHDADWYLRDFTPERKPPNSRYGDTTKADAQPFTDSRVTQGSETGRSAPIASHLITPITQYANSMENRRALPPAASLASSEQYFIHQEHPRLVFNPLTADSNSLVPEGEVFADPCDPRIAEYIDWWTREVQPQVIMQMQAKQAAAQARKNLHEVSDYFKL